ncbi:PLP-dependent transferase [Burkholderia ubonensis]|uniref:PLP-dependent transferase n=1 Tax=Burkholderia ubonensis TaxID=101571 RepID=UPI0009B4983F|nr:PLP-dependent transferase [Burkholderia ubonensis]
MVFRALLDTGDQVMMLDQAFYEIREQLAREAASRDLRITWIRYASSGSLEATYDGTTQLVYIETPTNPTLRGANLPAVAVWCASRNYLLVVGNTVRTSLGQNPLSGGAHLTLYSLTKHLNGHDDMVSGMVYTNRSDRYDKLKGPRGIDGLMLDPFSSRLAVRDLRTLSIRLQRHAANAFAVTQMLTREFPGITWGTAWATPHARQNGVSLQLNTGLIVHRFSRSIAMCVVNAVTLVRLVPTIGNLESLRVERQLLWPVGQDNCRRLAALLPWQVRRRRWSRVRRHRNPGRPCAPAHRARRHARPARRYPASARRVRLAPAAARRYSLARTA